MNDCSFMAEACLVAENMSIPWYSKKFVKNKMFHEAIPFETNACNDRRAAAEESFRRNWIFTALEFIINDLANCLEVCTNSCDVFFQS